MIERLDGCILHALQLSPRVSFRRIADVVGASEQTVARRYHGLRRGGVVRVVGQINPRVHGEAQWVVRLRAKPDNIPRLAEALVRRPEVTHANVLSGWTELVCIVRAVPGETRDGVLQRLPRTTSVLDLDVDLVLHTFDDALTEPWTAYGHKLDSAQAAQILGQTRRFTPTGQLIVPTSADRALFDALLEDGRASRAHLAERTGWSAQRVTRRLAALESSATLTYEVDLLPDQLGFRLNAMLWLTTVPRHVAAVGRQIAAHDEIASVVAVSGRSNLMAVAICRDVDHLYRYLTEQLATIEHIDSYDVRVRAQRLKQTASLISHGRLIGAKQAVADRSK